MKKNGGNDFHAGRLYLAPLEKAEDAVLSPAHDGADTDIPESKGIRVSKVKMIIRSLMKGTFIIDSRKIAENMLKKR